jgi:hypothetical protein
LLDLHPQGVRVVVVEDDERFAHGQTVEGVEHERVAFSPLQQTQVDFTHIHCRLSFPTLFADHVWQ